MKLATILVLLLAASSAWSDSLRCERGVIEPGITSSTVLRKCGEPESKLGGQMSCYEGICRKTERWIYASGGREHILIIEDDIVRVIRDGERR